MYLNIPGGYRPSGLEKALNRVEHLFLLLPRRFITREARVSGEPYFMTILSWLALVSFRRLEDWLLGLIEILMYRLNHPYQTRHRFAQEVHTFGELPIA